MATSGLPDRMRALTLTAYGAVPAALSVATCPVPALRPGEVLVKVAAAPVNPSDLAFMDGQYAFRKHLPAIPGLEGAGRVVAVGSGLMARRLSGRRVACAAQASAGGTWAEFVVASAMQCFVLPDDVDDRAGAMALVNPLAAIGLVERVLELRSPAMVSTAASSALGRMLMRHASRRHIQVINVVRRAEQVRTLGELGFRNVLNSGDPDFESRLKELCGQLRARVALDAISGGMTARLLSALPPGGRVIIYGGLSGQAAEVPPGEVVFKDRAVEGFYVPTWLAHKSLPQLVLMQRSVTRMLKTELGSEVRIEVGLAEAPEAIEQYRSVMSGGKVLIRPNG